jgi:hypothetical protein
LFIRLVRIAIPGPPVHIPGGRSCWLNKKALLLLLKGILVMNFKRAGHAG